MTLRTSMALLLTLLCLGLVLATRGSTAEPPVVPPALMQAASSQGTVRVILELGGTGMVPEELLPNASAVAAQRQVVGLAQSSVRQALHGTTHRVPRQYQTIPSMAIEASPAALRMLDSLRGVVTAVHEDIKLRPFLQQTVSLIGANASHAEGFTGSGVVIAVLDTGVDSTHPFLSGNVVDEACFAGNFTCPNGSDTQIGPGAAAPCDFAANFPGEFNECSHGTHVAGIAAGNGGAPADVLPRTGIASGADIMAVQVFTDDSGQTAAFVSDVIAGLEYVLLRSQSRGGPYNIAAVNLSLGGGFSTVNCDSAIPPVTTLMNSLRAARIAPVVAAGNDGFINALSFPACISSTISVGATGDGGPESPPGVPVSAPLDQVAPFSNAASFLSLFAPGFWITSSVPATDPSSNLLGEGAGYSTIAGTSQATPHVAGAFAVLRQVAPTASVTTLLTALQSTGTPITDTRAGFPSTTKKRINLFAAVQKLLPDLTVTAASTVAGAGPGTSINVAYTVRNDGGGPATGFTVGFALVPVDAGGTPNGGDIPIGPTTTALPALAAGASVSKSSSVLIPGTVTPGIYKIRVIADAGGAVHEDDETNNTRLTAGILTIARADLTGQSVTFTPAASRPNGSLSVTLVVKNLRPAPGTATPSISRLMLSQNGSIFSGIDLGVVNVPQISGGATATVAKTVTIPPTTPSGLYYVVATIDDANTIVETNEDNNFGRSATQITIGPDIAVLSARTAPGAAPGANASVTYTLANRGGLATAPFSVGFTLVQIFPDMTSGPEVPIGPARTGVILAAGATQTFVSSAAIPNNTPPGTYRIAVLANPDPVIDEASFGNNKAFTGFFNIGPDLAVTSVTFTPAAVLPGANVSVTHTVKNLSPPPGNAPASTSSIGFARVGDPTTALMTVNVPALMAGGSTTVTKSVQIPPVTAPGLYRINATADAAGGILEANETNNVATAAASLIVGPDIVVTAASTAAATGPGRNASVTYTLKNQGAGTTPAFDVRLALVPASDPDVSLGVTQAGVVLGPGASKSFVNTVVIPDVPAGPYRIRVIADPADTVNEADETNNSRLTGVVNVNRPDLAVASLTVTAAIVSGANVSVTHVVRNLAAAPGNALASPSGIYLSLSPSFDGVVGPPLATVPIPPLNAGVSSPALMRSVAPGALAPGRYFILVRADDAAAITEPLEGNNIASRPFLVGPDITVSAASTATGAIPGANVSVSHTLRNLGAAVAGPFDVAFVLVPVSAPDTEIPLGVTRTGVVLGAGVTAPVAMTAVPIPRDVAPGQYRIRVKADPGNAVIEADETNNSLTTAIITITPPELSMTVLTVPLVGIANRNLAVPNTVRNNAAPPGTASAFQVGLYLSNDDVIDPASDTLLASRTVTTLAPGAASAATTTVRLPTTTGDYFIGAFADHADVIAEGNEANNTLARPIAIVPEMVRNTSALLLTTFSNCSDPDGNGSATDTGRLVIPSQNGHNFTATLSLFTGVPGAAVTFAAPGAVQTDGSIAGTMTFTVTFNGSVLARGAGTYTGTATSSIGGPGTLQASITGAYTQGETCTFTATLTAPDGAAAVDKPLSRGWQRW